MNPPDTPEIPYIPGGVPGRPLPPQFGPKPAAINRTRARRQVREMSVRLVNRCAALGIPIAGWVTGGFSDDADVINRVVAPIWMMLTSPEPSARVQGATYVLAGLCDIGEREDPGWWERDLGRMVAREVGSYSPAGISQKIAAAVLGVTRQAIGQMIRRGDLREEDGRVSQQSLRLAAERRWVREDDIPA